VLGLKASSPPIHFSLFLRTCTPSNARAQQLGVR
jgi:hypothetical protein